MLWQASGVEPSLTTEPNFAGVAWFFQPGGFSRKDSDRRCAIVSFGSDSREGESVLDSAD
jgi:hypothetical protein